MNLHLVTPYSQTKNLGEAYNDAMRLIPDSDVACIMDYDTMLLLPDTVRHIYEYATQYQNSLLTCYTNRIHKLSPQLYNGVQSESDSVREHIKIAEHCKQDLYSVKQIDILSGFLMVIPKSLWDQHKFSEAGGLLGVDSNYRERLNANGISILLMKGLYVWHTYRLMTNVKDKSHLQ